MSVHLSHPLETSNSLQTSNITTLFFSWASSYCQHGHAFFTMFVIMFLIQGREAILLDGIVGAQIQCRSSHKHESPFSLQPFWSNACSQGPRCDMLSSASVLMLYHPYSPLIAIQHLSSSSSWSPNSPSSSSKLQIFLIHFPSMFPCCPISPSPIKYAVVGQFAPQQFLEPIITWGHDMPCLLRM